LPRFAANFFVGNAWDWEPPKRFRYVYSLYDCVPPDYLGEYVARLLSRVVAPGGRLIIGAYGSRSRGLPPFDIAGFLRSRGFNVVGASQGGEPAMTGFAWLDA
jgi:predicted methyltransferase